MKSKTFILLIFLQSSISFAQTKEVNNWVSLSSENDFLGLAVTSDRYYSYGERVDFMKRLKSDSIKQIFFSVRLRLEGHTPKYKGKVEADGFRRPFFGWMHSEIRKIETSEKNYYRYGIDIGISGLNAMAGDYQNWYHETLIDDRFVDGWENQTPNKVGLNLLVEYKRTLLATNHSALRVGSENSLGNILTFISPTINYQFNTLKTDRYLPFNYSQSRKGNFSMEAEFGFKYEFHNAALQGEYFSHSEDFLTDEVILRALLVGSFGIRYTIGHFSIYLNNSFNSKRVKENDFHNTGILGIGWLW